MPARAIKMLEFPRHPEVLSYLGVCYALGTFLLRKLAPDTGPSYFGQLAELLHPQVSNFINTGMASQKGFSHCAVSGPRDDANMISERDTLGSPLAASLPYPFSTFPGGSDLEQGLLSQDPAVA